MMDNPAFADDGDNEAPGGAPEVEAADSRSSSEYPAEITDEPEEIVEAAEALHTAAKLDIFVTQRATKVIASTNVRPTNFHQATYYFVLDPGSSPRTKLQFLITSYAMVLIQILAAASLVVAISKVTCGSTVNEFSQNECPPGTWLSLIHI